MKNHKSTNALTIDVEDYFQVSAFEHRISRDGWERFVPRVQRNTNRLLEILAHSGIKGTFFVLGWVAERHPSLIKDIANAGHEIASHGFWHQLIYNTTPRQFRRDVRESKDVIEQISQQPVTAFRAPSFSVTVNSLWALEILIEAGYAIDSSIFPISHDRYGMRSAPLTPHSIQTSQGTIIEFPPSVLRMGRLQVPVAGGGYFRLYPLRFTQHAIRSINARGEPFMFYLHPWEIDPEQPRIQNVGFQKRWRHYVGLDHTESKLQHLLSTNTFGTLTEALQSYQRSNSLKTVSYGQNAA